MSGRISFKSGFFEPIGINTLITPAYGGWFYYPAADGFTVLQVMPTSV